MTSTQLCMHRWTEGRLWFRTTVTHALPLWSHAKNMVQLQARRCTRHPPLNMDALRPTQGTAAACAGDRRHHACAHLLCWKGEAAKEGLTRLLPH
jgi:hypothetical protein